MNCQDSKIGLYKKKYLFELVLKYSEGKRMFHILKAVSLK